MKSTPRQLWAGSHVEMYPGITMVVFLTVAEFLELFQAQIVAQNFNHQEARKILNRHNGHLSLRNQ
ncbi:MAG: hypothetical protein ACI845_001836 [Gammaproteobacteria bacterium]|jgi:hypothetical protein